MTDLTTEFTPYASLAGGVLIGLGSVLLMATHGRIMGATGILSGVFTTTGVNRHWRIALLLGMFTGPWVYFAIFGGLPDITATVSRPLMALGGLIVGVGVTLGAGCTSGHGVCGMARLSPRSIAATLTFMLFTGITVFVLRHVLGG